MSNVTKLHPDQDLDSQLFYTVIGEVAVEDGYKLPETEEELDIYERRLETKGFKHTSPYSSIHEALAATKTTNAVRYSIKINESSTRHSLLAARNGTVLGEDILNIMDAAADEDENDQ